GRATAAPRRRPADPRGRRCAVRVARRHVRRRRRAAAVLRAPLRRPAARHRGVDGGPFLARAERRRYFGTALVLRSKFLVSGGIVGFLKGIINAVADPRLFFLLAVAGLVVIVWKREVVAENAVGYGLLGLLGVFFVFGTFDPNFRLIVTKPDNVPIVGLIFLLLFFVWYSIREAVLNDRRIAAGQGPIEKDESDRVWVWP